MPDLSKNRARPSSVSRSSGGQAASTAGLGPQVRSVDFARDVSGEGATQIARGQGFIELGQQLRGFAQAERFREQTDHIKEMRSIERLNQKRAQLANATAKSNPNALREALKSGDFSQLPLDESITHSEVFFNTAHQELAISAANEHAASQGFLAGVSASEAPDDFVNTWVETQTEGMPPVAASAYATQLTSASNKVVAQRKAVMAQTVASENVATVYKNFEANPPTTLEELDSYIGAVRAGASVLGPQAEMDAQAGLEQHLLKQAIVEEQPWAWKLVEHKSADRNNGLSIAERHREAAEALEQQAIGEVGDIQTRAEAKSLQLIQTRIQEGDLYGAGEMLIRHKQEYGAADGSQSDEYLRQLAAFESGWNTQHAGLMLDNAIVAEQYTAIDEADLKKADLRVHSQWDQIMAQQGVPQEQWLPRQARLIEMFEPSGKMKTRFGQLLSQGDERTIALLDHLGDEAQLALPKQYHTLWEAMQFNPNTQEAIANWREQQQNQRSFSKETAIEDVLRITGKADRKAMFEDVTTAAIGQSAAAGQDTTFGVPTGFLGDQLDPSDPEEVDQSLVAQAEDFISQVILDHPKMTQVEQLELAAKRMSDSIAIEMRDGRPRAVWSPINLRGAVGSVGTKVTNPDITYMGEAVTHLESNLAALTGNQARPRFRGHRRPADTQDTAGAPLVFDGDVEVDSLTGQNMGVVPLFKTADGGRVAMTYEEGTVQFLPPELANSAMFKGWGEPSEAADLIDPLAPEGWLPRVPPAHGTMVDDRLMWATVDGFTTLRYVGPDIQTQTQMRLDAKNRPLVQSGQGSKPAVNRNTRKRLSARAASEQMAQMAASSSMLDNKAKNFLVASAPADPHEGLSLIRKAHAESNVRGEYLLDLTGSPRALEYVARYDKFLAVNEGPSTSYVYDDEAGSGTRLNPGDKVVGARTIGRGYNMERGDWPSVSARLGLSKEKAQKVLMGEEELTDGQLNRLNAILSQEAARGVYNHYESFGELPEHFYLARMSMWHHGLTKTPAMDKALLAGDWNAVAEEILFRSMGGATKETKRGFKARRAREARLLLGDKVKLLRPELQEILLRVDPWKGMATHGDY